jgi:glycosyltransferase involved in cell wall biosynthesis
VVASDLPYFREVLADDPTAGVFCRPDDASGLAAAVETFFAGDVPARHAAARRLADRYAWSEVIKPVAERMTATRAAVTAGTIEELRCIANRPAESVS